MPMTNQYISNTFKIKNMIRKLNVCDLGLIEYQKAWDIQKEFHRKRTLGEIDDILFLCEHPHTYTLGKVANEENLLLNKSELQKKGISVFEIDRGGDITYHGPGQIVGYAILNLTDWKKDTHLYLRTLEEVIIQTCTNYGIESGRNEKYTGVWIKNRKICAIGIKVSRWITMHGFAFNVNTDLNLYNGIIPCGISDKEVTSLEKELNKELEIDLVKENVIKNFLKIFEYNVTKKVNLNEIEKDLNRVI